MVIDYKFMSSENKIKIREFYDQLGGRIYDIRYRDEQKIKYGKLLNMVDLGKNYLILDDGCGTGLLIRSLKTYVVGLDISENLIFTARKRLKRRRYVSLIISDAEELPIRSNIFDLVFSVTLLQNLNNSVKALNEMRRVAKKEGKILVTALKKAFSEFDFKKLMESSFLQINKIVLDDAFDWMALVSSC